jgi:hypothetical protein
LRSAGKNFREKSRILVLLSRLNLTNMAEQFSVVLRTPQPSFVELLEVLADWQICWHVRPEILAPLVKDLIEQSWLDPDCPRVVQYLGPLVRNCFVEFLNDLTLCKENVAAGAAVNLRINVATGARRDAEHGGTVSNLNVNESTTHLRKGRLASVTCFRLYKLATCWNEHTVLTVTH